jgi:hypothetical protein
LIAQAQICFAERQTTLLLRVSQNTNPYPPLHDATKVRTMTLFKNDLYRNLGFGFLLGAMGVVIANPALTQAVAALV